MPTLTVYPSGPEQYVIDPNRVDGGPQYIKASAVAPTADTIAAAIAAIPADAAAGTPSLRTLSTTATTAAAGNDSRLSNARTPTAHATSHNAGGSDVLAIDAAAGTGSLRTLGTGATQAAAGTTLASANTYADAGDAAVNASVNAFESQLQSDATGLIAWASVGRDGVLPAGPSMGKINGMLACGNATLVAGVKTVTFAGSTSTMELFVTPRTTGGTLGANYKLGTVVASTSFQIVSVLAAGTTQTLDTSTVSYHLIEPF